MPTLEQETRRFTVDDLRRMLEAGILAEDEPVQLIEGRLVVMTPQGPEHSYVTTSVAQRLRTAYGCEALVREEKPIVTGSDSQLEPDVAVVRGSLEDYASHHPTAAEAILVVEVALTSHAQDRVKVELYARGGVEACWLVDVPQRRVEVHAEPQPDGRYRLIQLLAGGDLLAVPGREDSFTVDSIFPTSWS